MKMTSPNMEPPEPTVNQAIANALHNERTIAGYGRRQHGLNGKDADLDYGGQCIVDEIRVVDGTSKDQTMFLEIDVTRYASICEPEDKTQRPLAEEIICTTDDYPGEWTGSDYWSFSHRETVRVPLTVDEYDNGTTEENLETLAERCVSAINAAPGRAFETFAENLAKQIGNLGE